MIHVHQCFNAVGHGTFFTGIVYDRLRKKARFSWVYDCGSKRPTAVAREIAELEPHLWPDVIDLLVLSHFDDDHVNGVEQFLRTRRVRVLALPYLDIAHRLLSAASVVGEPCSASTAVMQLDPTLWLRSRGLSERVESIVFVGGAPGRDGGLPLEMEPRPRPTDDETFDRQLNPVESPDGDTIFGASQPLPPELRVDLGGSTAADPSLRLWQQDRPVPLASLPIEMMFFNSRQENLFRSDNGGGLTARRSGASVSKIQAEVQDIVDRYRLLATAKPARKQWREKLRTIYGRHFGKSANQRNNISLCVLVRPLRHPVEACAFFGSLRRYTPRLVRRAGMLCLGDLKIDPGVLASMQAHFGATRWESLGVVQVPHHGSRHSWTVGSAAQFAPDWFVQCVPDQSADHPHESVEKDLQPFPVAFANYQTRRSFDYHFK